MAKYKSNQCPDCGCEKFMQPEEWWCTYTFNKKYKYFNDQRTATQYIKSIGKKSCDDCTSFINELESNKQGRIILADK